MPARAQPFRHRAAPTGVALAQQRLGQGQQARTFLAGFEKWYKGRKFDTWQETTRWRLLHKEARRLLLTMPRSTE